MRVKSIDLLNVSQNSKLYFAKYFEKKQYPINNSDNNLIYGLNVVIRVHSDSINLQYENSKL